MNASEQAKGLELTAKIATLVNLFKQQFPDAKADLKPWRNDPHTRELTDPDSIDIAFHFPGWSPRIQGRSILVQIRFHLDSEDQHQRLIGLEMQAFNHQMFISTCLQFSIKSDCLLVFNKSLKLRVCN